MEDHFADEEDDDDEYAALFNLETRWAGGDEAEAIGNVQDSRLDPVAPGGEGEAGGVEAAIDDRGAPKGFDACVDVAEGVS